MFKRLVILKEDASVFDFLSALSKDWVVFIGLFISAIAVDLLFFRGKTTFRAAFFQTLFYVGIALAFGGYIFSAKGEAAGGQYLTGWIVEYSLSIDNLFVIALIFNRLKIKKKEQRTLLYAAVFGAFILRGVAITLGVEAVEHFWFTLPLMGAFLVYTGWTMFSAEETDDEPKFLTLLRRTGIKNFWLAFATVNVADLFFATDSIPAIFSITTDPFLVFTSNMMALLGLRSLYFCLEVLKERFHLLEKVIPFLLMGIGIKIISEHLGEIGKFLVGIGNVSIPTYITIAVIIVALVGSVVFSTLFPPRKHYSHSD